MPVRHYGSVDIFFEALKNGSNVDILVIDNERRENEACVGDLVVLETKLGGLGAIIIWGSHRDTPEIISIDFPVFSYGSYPAGPVRLDPRPNNAIADAKFGEFTVSDDDIVFADDDGVIFVPKDQIKRIIDAAIDIQKNEYKQSKLMRNGTNLRQQLNFKDYLTKRETDPEYTFRDHLKVIGGDIEE